MQGQPSDKHDQTTTTTTKTRGEKKELIALTYLQSFIVIRPSVAFVCGKFRMSMPSPKATARRVGQCVVKMEVTARRAPRQLHIQKCGTQKHRPNGINEKCAAHRKLGPAKSYIHWHRVLGIAAKCGRMDNRLDDGQGITPWGRAPYCRCIKCEKKKKSRLKIDIPLAWPKYVMFSEPNITMRKSV